MNKLIRVITIDYILDESDKLIPDNVEVYINPDHIVSVEIHPIMQHDLRYMARYRSPHIYLNVSNGERYMISSTTWEFLRAVIT